MGPRRRRRDAGRAWGPRGRSRGIAPSPTPPPRYAWRVTLDLERLAAALPELDAGELAGLHRAWERRGPDEPSDFVSWLHARGALADATLLRLARSARAPVQVTDSGHLAPDQGLRVVGEVGRGAMGEVLLARDERLGRTVALKRLDARYVDDPGLVHRFLVEAQLTAQLDHPGIVPVHGIRTDAGEPPAYSMKLVRGRTLKAFMTEAREAVEQGKVVPRALRLPARLELFCQICEPLAYAHARGVLHRDLKPDNIMVGAFGAVFVMDWGVARVRVGAEGAAGAVVATAGGTLAGDVVGTPAYMSPEQVRGESDIDIRSDLYALGATMFCLLTGHPPFQGGTSYVITNAVLTAPAPDVRQFNRTVSAATAAIIRTALIKDRRLRHPTPAALRVDCERALGDLPLAFAAVPDAPPKEIVAPTPPSPTGGLGREAPSLTIDPTTTKILAYGSGAMVLMLVVWSLGGETHVNRPATAAPTQPTASPEVARTAPWMSAEGRDEVGPWAEFRREGLRLRLRPIPAGTFLMGSPNLETGRSACEPQHEVTLTTNRWMSETEISRGTWATITGHESETHPDLPVTGINWYEVQEFLKKLSDLGLPARLPTEAEWEHAARAGSETAYATGDVPDPRDWLGQPAMVGPRIPDPLSANRFGLLDMPGNVREWVEDAWDGKRPHGTQATTDPCETFGGFQVVRGGAWDTPPHAARSAARSAVDPQIRDERIGFRLVVGK